MQRGGAGFPIAGLLIVGLPTLLAAIYFLLIASPRYVSEARFISCGPQIRAAPPLARRRPSGGGNRPDTDRRIRRPRVRDVEGWIGGAVSSLFHTGYPGASGALTLFPASRDLGKGARTRRYTKASSASSQWATILQPELYVEGRSVSASRCPSAHGSIAFEQ